MDQDAEHLRLLSIFHYVVGGMLAFFACFFIIYIIMGLVVVSSPSIMHGQGAPPPRLLGWFFALFGCFFVFLGWMIAALIIYAGRCLSQRKNYLYCLVIAGVSCLFMPFGTVLGIFTILILQRPRVKEMFNQWPARA